MDVFIRPVESAKSTYPTVPMVIGSRVLAARGWHMVDCVHECMTDFDTPSRALARRGRWGSDGEGIGPMAAEDNGVEALVTLCWDGVEVTSPKGFTCIEEDATKKGRDLTMGFSYLVSTSVTKLSS